MTATALDAVLDQFDAALAAQPIQHDPLINAFRALQIPTGVTDAQLSRVLSVCCRVLGGDANPPDRDLKPEQGNHHVLRPRSGHAHPAGPRRSYARLDREDAGPVPRARSGDHDPLIVR